MTWFWLYLRAILRGLRYPWPSAPRIPRGYSAVSCGLRDWKEARAMAQYGWKPWLVRRTPGLGKSRVFLLKNAWPDDSIPRLWVPEEQLKWRPTAPWTKEKP